jgi:hypothetical protein
VTVKTCGQDVPIYLPDDVVDMRCTLYDRIYRKRLEIRNRGKAAYRVNIKVHPLFSKYIEVNPVMLFVQAKASQVVNIKFAPTVDIMQKLAHFSVPFEQFTDAATLTIPVEIQVWC